MGSYPKIRLEIDILVNIFIFSVMGALIRISLVFATTLKGTHLIEYQGNKFFV